jgi:hypothetical protein
MKAILAAVLCSAAIIGQVSTASAYYYYGSPAGIYCPVCAQPPEEGAGWDNQPIGQGKPYRASYLANGRPVCAHRNYRPTHGWCQRVW